MVTVLDEHTPAAFNNPELTARVLDVFRQSIGAESVLELQPEMVGEDFGRYGSIEPRIPSMMFRLGTVAKDRYQLAQQGELSLPTLHSASYAPDTSVAMPPNAAHHLRCVGALGRSNYTMVATSNALRIPRGLKPAAHLVKVSNVR